MGEKFFSNSCLVYHYRRSRSRNPMSQNPSRFGTSNKHSGVLRNPFVYKGFLVWGRHSRPGFSQSTCASPSSSEAITSQMAIHRVVRKGSGSISISLLDEEDGPVRVLLSVKKNSDRIGELLFQNVCVHVPRDTCVDNWVQNAT